MIDKDSLPLDRPRRTPDHPTKSHVVKTKVDGKERIIRFGEQGAETAGKPKAGESERMKAKRASFKARHAKNIAKGRSSPAYWADKVKWAEGGAVGLRKPASPSDVITDLMGKVKRGQSIREQEEQQLESMRRLLSSRRLGSARRSPLTELRSTDPTTSISSSPPPESVEPSAGAGTPQPVQVVQPVSSAALNKPAADNPYYAEAVRLAEKYNLPAGVFVSLVNQESRFNPEARSPKGAIGLGQLMPGTAKELGVDPTDPLQNLDGAARYLRQQIDRFGSVPLALAAYNAGPGNVRKYGGIPPFKETQNYVAQVMKGAGGEQPGYAGGGAVKKLIDVLSKKATLVPKLSKDEALSALESSQKANLQHQPLIESLHGYHKTENPKIAAALERMYDDMERKVDLDAAARSFDEGYVVPGSRISFSKDIGVRSPRAQTPGLHFAAAGNERQLQPFIETYASEFAPDYPRAFSPTTRPVLARADKPIQLADEAFEFPDMLARETGLTEELRRALDRYYSQPRDFSNVDPEELKSALITKLLSGEGVDLGAYNNVSEGVLGPENTSFVSFGKDKLRGFAGGGAVPLGPMNRSGVGQTMAREFSPDEIEEITRLFNEGGYVSKYARGGEVEAEIKATPQNPVLGGLARGVKSVQELASKYSLPEAIPLVGGMGVDELLGLPGAARETERWSYGNYPLRVNPYAGRTAGYLPETKPGRQADLADTVFLGADVVPLTSLATKYGTRGALAAGKQLEGIAERAVPQIMERGGAGAEALLGLSGGTRSQVIKPKGGNWLAGYIDNAVDSLRPIRVVGQTPAERIPLHEALLNDPRLNADQLERVRYQLDVTKGEAAVDKWLDTKLRKYIQNEMGTPEDPIRELAERGVLHAEFTPASDYNAAHLGERRAAVGYPAEGMGRSEQARAWEAAADDMIHNLPAGQRLNIYSLGEEAALKALKNNPWLQKVPPETMTYGVYNVEDAMQFNHLVDEMRNAMRPDTDLPARLRIDPDKLEKMTVPQIVEKVSQINAWRAEQQAAANAAKAMNPATQVFKEYPEQGYRWVELKAPENVEKLDDSAYMLQQEYLGAGVSPERAYAEASKRQNAKILEDALKYEGDVMGHCVGGYCPDVIEGRSRIFSLRDSKGEPHVTIEVQPGKREGERALDYRELTPENYARKYGDDSDLTERIVQIKGKANRAPKEEYLPFVQDFVKSQNWSDVGDIQNTGLISSKTLFRDSLDPVWNRVRNAIVEKHPNATMSKEDVKQLIGNDYITEQEAIDRLSDYFKKAGYAAGGLVSAYNPEAVDAMVNQILEGAYV